MLWLLNQVVESFESRNGSSKGLPLGNLTSQLLVNVYMNEFDQFVKRTLKTKYYIRYADDFLILHQNKQCLQELLLKIDEFLRARLCLRLHPKKVSITTLASGIDFLGWVHFSHHRVLRTVTKRRMFKRLELNPSCESLASYLGLLGHGDAYGLANAIKVIVGPDSKPVQD